MDDSKIEHRITSLMAGNNLTAAEFGQKRYDLLLAHIKRYVRADIVSGMGIEQSFRHYVSSINGNCNTNRELDDVWNAHIEAIEVSNLDDYVSTKAIGYSGGTFSWV
jgi:hypothetical protein